MNFLHYDLNLGSGEVVEVTLDKQANVLLLDDTNFSNYKRGLRHSYFGGLAKRSPVRLAPPRPGHWHLVIDLGGYAGSVSASVQTHRAA
ncbi:DUF1883 domain-containing protein [Pseudolabrys taiwanensis]|uniref:DUF1883 domain-containing protein n=1 Tax=Pseudolabrys taiwanensis TaxID=331696 RepID=A0A345ZT38_9HYPH|nr:DUF1883 domain-containing protein [Pseudolabrys taiwanensis]